MKELQKFIIKYEQGSVIYNIDDSQDFFYIVNKGKIQISNKSGLEISLISKGDFFGEECLVTENKSNFKYEALEESALIKIPPDVLQDMMKKNCDISVKILKKLAEKNRKIFINLENKLKFDYKNDENEDTKYDIPEEKVTKNNNEKKLFCLNRFPKNQVKTTKDKKDDKVEEQASNNQDIIPKDINAHIIIERSNRLIKLKKSVTFIGRRDFASHFMPEVDLTLEDEEKYISRKHGQINYSNGKFYFSESAGAMNGTFLNGNKLPTGVKYELNNEDQLTLCHINILFKLK